MKLAELKKSVDAMRDASRFRHGDPHTFSVPFMPLEVELPGPSDPAAYLANFQTKTKTSFAGARCLVVGAGNGGLCAALLNLGAKEVVAADDRDRFHAALDEVIRLLSSLHEFDPLTYRSWPSSGCEKSLGQFDLIFFPESLEECREPCETLETVCRLLTPEGALFVEVHHGAQYVIKDPVNSFRPTEDAFVAMMKQITGSEPLFTLPGRAGNRKIHVISRSHQLGHAVAHPPAPMPAFPRDRPVKSVLPPRFPTPESPQPRPAPPKPPKPPKPAPLPEPSDPEKDPRLGHMLNGPPLSEAALARHRAESPDRSEPVDLVEEDSVDWRDTFQPPLDQIDDAPEEDAPIVKRLKKKKKKKTKKPVSDDASDSAES